MAIDKTAIVSPHAKLGTDVSVGPYSVVGEHVELGDGVRLHSHVVVEGHTQIGEGCEIFPFASLGHIPQDLKYKGEDSRLAVGARTVIREHVTLNPGTEGGGGMTRVGASCLLMVGAHVAHDCVVGDGVIMANNATLAGHVHVGDGAVIGGLAAVHQFVRIGHHAMIGGMSGIESDVIPFGQASGERAHLVGLNLVGLKRHGFSRDDIQALRAAYKHLFASSEGTLRDRLTSLLDGDTASLVREVTHFIEEKSSRALCQPNSGS